MALAVLETIGKAESVGRTVRAMWKRNIWNGRCCIDGFLVKVKVYYARSIYLQKHLLLSVSCGKPKI